MRTILIGAMFVLGCGGAGDPVAATPASEADDSAIQGGEVDKSDPAVGLVWMRGGGFCTGTLIASDVVLTAGHCVESAVAGFYTGAGKAVSRLGSRPAAGFVAHEVAQQIAHPSYRALNRCPNPTFDVALLRLARPIDAIAPVPLATRAPRRGASCRTVGYGVHNDGAIITVEQKRAAVEVVAAIEDSAIFVTKQSGIVDHGDSGGPLVCSGRIAGTTSCGNGADSPEHRDGWYGRIDPIGAWVEETIAGWH